MDGWMMNAFRMAQKKIDTLWYCSKRPKKRMGRDSRETG